MVREDLMTRCYESGGCTQVYMQPMCGGQGLRRSSRRFVQFLDMYGSEVHRQSAETVPHITYIQTIELRG